MNNTEKEIPEEIKNWIKEASEEFEDALQWGHGFTEKDCYESGALDMYQRDQAEIASLRAERDAARKVIEWIAGNENSFMGDRLLSKEFIDKYPSPKE